MANNIEWAHARYPARIVLEVTDPFGNTLDEGNIGLAVGEAILEGTPAELARWLTDALAEVGKYAAAQGDEAQAKARDAAAGIRSLVDPMSGRIDNWSER